MRRLTLIAGLSGALVAWGCGSGASDRAAAAEAHDLARERESLEAWVELAASDQPYLVLDSGERKLKLMLSGATLREYPVLQQDIRTPRVAFFGIGTTGDPRGRAWTAGRLDPAPQRVQREVVPPDEAATTEDSTDAAQPPEEEAAIPPLPEEAVPAPARYAIRFAGDFALEVRTSPRTGGRSFSEVAEVLSGRGTAGISLVIPEAEAGALYRSLGEETALIVR